MTAKQLVRSAASLFACAFMVLMAEPGEAQRTKTATKKPAPQTPAVLPTASDASKATARRRTSNAAAVKSVNAALRVALAQPAVRTAVLAEVRRQLRVNRPIALVSGYWVSVVNLAPVYQLPNVRTQLVAGLGSNGVQLVAAAAQAREGLILGFTPNQIAQLLMPDLVRDVTRSFAPDAVAGSMTGLTGVEVLFIMAMGYLLFGNVEYWGGLLWDAFWSWYESPDRSEGDKGKENDKDGDDVPDDKDNYPDDPSRSICDCTRPAVYFGTAVPGDVLRYLDAALTAALKQKAGAISVGPIVTTPSGALALVF